MEDRLKGEEEVYRWKRGGATMARENVASIFLISYRNGRPYRREIPPVFRGMTRKARSLNWLPE